MNKEEKQQIIERILELREENQKLISRINGESTISASQSLEKAEDEKDATLKALLYTNLDINSEKDCFFIEHKEKLCSLGKAYTSFQPEVFDEFRVDSVLKTCVYCSEISAIRYSDKTAYYLTISDPYRTFSILMTDEHDADYDKYLEKHLLVEYIKNIEHIPESNTNRAIYFMTVLSLEVYE